MSSLRRTMSSLSVRIILPLIVIILLIGAGLYFFVLRSVSDFADGQIKEGFSNMALDVYRISDRSLNELLQSGRSADEKAVIITKGLTIGQIEDYMRQSNLRGFITEGGRRVFSTGGYPDGLASKALDAGKESEVFTLWHEGKKYYVYLLPFPPWHWQIVLIKEAVEYAAMINKVKSVYGATAFLLILSTVLIIALMHRVIKMPIDSIIEPLRRGEMPAYKGIYEFEYLSDNIRRIMASLQRETERLNNIYHIAASTRGERFLDEVVRSIARMFGLNSLIARIEPEGDAARVLTMYLDGEIRKGLVISLKDGPGAGIRREREMVVIEKGASERFPLCGFIQSVKPEAFISFSIYDRKGDVIGMVNAFGKEREFSESDRKVFQTVGQMVETELVMIDEEQGREMMREQLLQAQKMEAVGRLAGGIAHDFNNILSAIIGYSELALLKMPKEDPLRKNVEIIHESANRAANLTQQLLAFSRKQIIKPEILNINSLIEDMMNMLRGLIGEDIRIEITKGEGLWNIRADRGQMEQVLMNLAINAMDAMPAGGTLMIETSNIVLDKDYTDVHLALSPGEYVGLVVSDTGQGMTEAVKRRIYEPFFTTKEGGKGTGLGLSTVYGIIKQHGGNIYVYSEPGKGTTFKIYFPRVKEVESEYKKDEIQALPRGTETVLLVEDEKEVRGLAATLLTELGYTVLEAEDAENALKMTRMYHGAIHLVLTDVIMPGMSGSDLAKEIRKCCPEIKILFMSGYTQNAIVKHGILKDGVNYLQKPFTTREFAQIVRRVLDGDKDFVRR